MAVTIVFDEFNDNAIALSGDLISRLEEEEERPKAWTAVFFLEISRATELFFIIHKPEPIVGLFKFVRLHEAAALLPPLPPVLPVQNFQPFAQGSHLSPFSQLRRGKMKTPIRADRRRRTLQITVKNGRPKLPCVSLMLLTLITSEWDLILSLFSPFLRRRGFEGKILSLSL